MYYYKGDQILAPLRITSNRQAFQVETLSLKQTTFLTEAQRWELSFSTAANSNEAESFLAHTKDFHSRQTMVMPQLNGPRNQLTFTGTLTAAATTGGEDTISITADGAGIIPAGYFIKFFNHNKIYVVTETVTFDSDTVDINIFPKLTSDLFAGTPMYLRDQATIRYQLDMSNMQGISFQDGIISGNGGVRLIEAI